MKLRHVDSYDIGLDYGTNSVGWAVVGQDGEPCTFNNRQTIGSRLFEAANTAAETRLNRGQRRRYERRRWRLNLLQQLFANEMDKTDKDFFIRLYQSRLWPSDRLPSCKDYHWPLFNDTDFNEIDYYKQFPTIYHLRKWLIEADQKADIRLIYLAFHNIVKHRGNFLREDNHKLSSEHADIADTINNFCDSLAQWVEQRDISFDVSKSSEEMKSSFSDASLRAQELSEKIETSLHFEVDTIDSDVDIKALRKNLSKAIVGYKADFSKIFLNEAEDSKFSLSDEEKVSSFQETLDDGILLYESIQAVYSGYILQGLLSLVPGKPLSWNKVAEYERYKNDLQTLKRLVHTYVPQKYKELFRGQLLPQSDKYDPSSAKGYTKYNLARGESYDAFKKEIYDALDPVALSDPEYLAVKESFENGTFLRRLKTRDNGAIPYQLHKEEMLLIIEAQGKYYPFLESEKDKLVSLVEFRIPYYVGPLTLKNARLDAEGKARFAWSERKPGKEKEKIYPWNWDQIIDKEKSAQLFIERMKGECTYLMGEPVLPKSSLLYEWFCVLNELDGAKLSCDGDRPHSFDFADRAKILEELFMKRKSVSYKQVEDLLKQSSVGSYRVSGGQGEKGFESKLSSYYFFCRDVFKTDELPQKDIEMVEDIIHWNTLFEDRKILKKMIEDHYGDRLNNEQIKIICRKRFTGWGKLSKRFLQGLKAQTDDGPKTIIDILYEGNPNNGHLGQAMNLQQILHDDKLGFQLQIDEWNKKQIQGSAFNINDLPGSPALRRTINQSFKIIDEIVRIAGKPPAHIYIENTRSDDVKQTGKRTQRRYENIKNALEAFKKEYAGEFGETYSQIKEYDKAALDDKRLVLYFMQNGKSLYSGKSLDINDLSSYQIDHIIPQSYIKDDSFENLALVLPEENQHKNDDLLIDASIRRKMKPYWDALHEAGLIGDKKYRNLMASSISDDRVKGFVARQLTETSQIIKLAQSILSEKYPETLVYGIKASLSSQLREALDLPKSREANDYHHAHDAFLACQIGRYIAYRYPRAFTEPIAMAAAIKKQVKRESLAIRKGEKKNPAYSFFIQGFLSSGFDKETGEIIRDVWDAPLEIDKIKRCLNRRDCYITRRLVKNTGAFWDATIYSPNAGKNLDLPVKQGLPVERYGGYSRTQFAYFSIIKIKNRKTGKFSLDYVPIPTYIAARLASTTGDQESVLENYFESVYAQNKKEGFVGVVRPQVIKNQLIEINGDRYFITGAKSVRNGWQLSFTIDEARLIKEMVNGVELDDKQYSSFITDLCLKYDKYAPRLSSLFNISQLPCQLENCSALEKNKVLLQLIQIANAGTNMIDLQLIGGSKNAGNMGLTFRKELSSTANRIYLIDQSVTGMFEKRERIGL